MRTRFTSTVIPFPAIFLAVLVARPATTLQCLMTLGEHPAFARSFIASFSEGLFDKMGRPQELMSFIRSFLSLIERFYSPKCQVFLGYQSIEEAFHSSDI